MTMRPQGASEELVDSQTGEPVRPRVVADPAGLTNTADRHPSVAHFGVLFAFGHLPVHLRDVSRPLAEAAASMCNLLADGPELAAGLRKLREAKDCFVTQAVIDMQRKGTEQA